MPSSSSSCFLRGSFVFLFIGLQLLSLGGAFIIPLRVRHERSLRNSVSDDGKSLIFYPEAMELNKDSVSGMNEDDLRYEMFLAQISKMGDESETSDNDNEDSKLTKNESFKNWLSGGAKTIASKVVERPTILYDNIPLEIIWNKRLVFGNFKSVNKNVKGAITSISVRRVSGEMVSIDPSQVISCWDDISDEDVPEDSGQWADVANEAMDILRDMSPRKSDLQEFWKLVSKRSNALSVDSLDLSVYIFQERKFRTWIDPFNEVEEAGVRAPSAAQRYAAAILMFNDDFHFKRKPTTVPKSPQPEDEDGLEEAPGDSLWIVEGSYKVLDEGLTMFREGDVFALYCEERMKGGPSETLIAKTPFRAGCISRQLRAIEVYSMSPESMSPPVSVKHLLKKLGKSTTPAGARELLRQVNLQTAATAGSASTKTSSVSVNVTPWTREELSAAKRLSEEVASRREQLGALPPMRDGKKGPSGRMDYRASQKEHPTICIDNKRASFFDDAFSLSPETGEVLVHVVDVAEYLRKYDELLATARERASSIFLPSGALHMLPFQALEALKLSSEGPNEVITVAISIDENGSLIGFRVFPSIIGPVFPVDVVTADEIIDGVGNGSGTSNSARPGFPEAVINDIIRSQKLVEKVIEKNSWVDTHFSGGNSREFKLNKKEGTYNQRDVEKTPANRMINALLTMYSNCSCEFVQSRGMDVPIAWENRDRIDSNIVRRFGTQPLRNWLAQTQQKQIRASMKMELGYSRKECAMIVSHHNSKRKQVSSLEGRGRETMSFETLATHCLNMLNSGQDQVILTAEGVGKGGLVQIKNFKVQGIVMQQTIAKGQLVKVSVSKLVPESKTVYLELLELEEL